jgi:streptogramin lyase
MRFAWCLAASTITLAVFTGCSVTSIVSNDPVNPPATPAVITPLRGIVRGGQQPVQQSEVYLFQVNTTGYGSPNSSKPLLNSNTGHSGTYGNYVLTNSTGGFSIGSTEYTCTSGTQVYLYSVGGNAGFGTNTAVGLMTVLGQCGSNNSFTGLPSTIEMNEVTTVAAAYALAGFAANSTAINATEISGSNTSAAATGMKNAAATAASLADIGTGLAQSTTAAGNGTVPTSEINTLADILAACVNSSGSTSSSCSTLFTNAKSGGSSGTAPSDTATAAINIAHNPIANISNLFALATSTSPFLPILSTAPNDWTVSIAYTASNLNGPSAIAVDASGNVWLTNSDGNQINKFSPAGAVSFTSPAKSGGLDNPFGIAIDASGNVWVANNGNGQNDNGNISEFSSTGTAKSGSSGIGGSVVSVPWGVAVDASGDIWISNFQGNSISEYNPGTSSFVSLPNGGQGGGLNDPLGIAVDHNGNVWTVNTGGGSGNGTSMSEYSPSQSKFLSPDPAGYSGGGLKGPVLLGIDHGGNVWASNEFSNVVSELNSSGTPVSTSGYSGGGLDTCDGIAVDGAGNVWISNHDGNSISEFNNSGSPLSGSSGFKAEQPYPLAAPQGMAVDLSGNLWVANEGDDTLRQFVGAAVPVVTPLVTGVINNTLGSKP